VQSKRFAIETGLAEELMDIIEAVEAAGGLASMVMLGNAVFAINGYEALKEFGQPITTSINSCGVKPVELKSMQANYIG
jgi:pantoate kinase